jgi:hypothetical protein
MKTLIPSLAMLFCTTALFAGDSNSRNAYNQNPEMKTVFGSSPTRVGAWAGVSTQFTSIDGADAILVGGKAGVIVNSSLTVGIAGYGISGYLNNLYYSELDGGRGAYLDGGYGGLFIEPVLASHLPVHISLPVIIGAGGAGYTKREVYEWHDRYYDHHDPLVDHSPFFVLEPGIEIEINLVKFMRLGIGASYRYTSGLDLINTKRDLLNNYSAGFTLKIGAF